MKSLESILLEESIYYTPFLFFRILDLLKEKQGLTVNEITQILMSKDFDQREKSNFKQRVQYCLANLMKISKVRRVGEKTALNTIKYIYYVG